MNSRQHWIKEHFLSVQMLAGMNLASKDAIYPG